MRKQDTKKITMIITLDECEIIMKDRKKKKERYLKRLRRRRMIKNLRRYLTERTFLIKQRGAGIFLILVGMIIWSNALKCGDGEMGFTGFVSALLGLGLLLAKKDLENYVE